MFVCVYECVTCTSLCAKKILLTYYLHPHTHIHVQNTHKQVHWSNYSDSDTDSDADTDRDVNPRRATQPDNDMQTEPTTTRVTSSVSSHQMVLMGNTRRQQRVSERGSVSCLPGAGRGQWATGQTQRTGQFTGTPEEGALSSGKARSAFFCSYVGCQYINIVMSSSRFWDLPSFINFVIIILH